ncbi:MSCRAMM family protein [Enterococcus dispar]|uniref:MSCRAMM family protein n=1 Tax=Enterococcus dispar TaxID=44009 RepID=UPI002331296B|nr:hypothetical protein [Enterococcus dispar]WCG33160.1 hypothetical protein PML78_00270 [Enterococcus dispar]
MKKKYKILAVFAILAILLPLFEGVFSISSIWRTSANEPVAENIISEDFLQVSQSHKVTEEDVVWNIQYEINVEDTSNDKGTTIEKAGKLKFMLPATLKPNLPENKFVKENNWYILKDFEKQTKGEIEVTAKKDTKFTMQFQFDEQMLTPVEVASTNEVDESEEKANVSDTQIVETINENILGANNEPVQYEFDYSKYDTNVNEENENDDKDTTIQKENQNTVEIKEADKADNNTKNDQPKTIKKAAILNEEDPFEKFGVETRKSAQLSTTENAWNDRLYDILLEVSSTSVPGELSGDLIIYLDASSSQNGGDDRREQVFKQLEVIYNEIKGQGNFRVAVVPCIQVQGWPASNSDLYNYMQYYTLDELFGTREDGTTLAKEIRECYNKNTGNNSLYPVMEIISGADKYPNTKTINLISNPPDGKLPLGLVIGGNNLNDQNDASNKIVPKKKTMHSDMIIALTDNDKSIHDNSMSNYKAIVEKPEYFFNKKKGSDAGKIIQEAFEKIREMMKIESLKVVDTIPDYFEIVSPTGKEEGITVEKNTVTFDSQTMTKNENTGRYEWSQTIQVKAKDDFIGGNVVATNEGSAQVFVDGSNKGKNFDIYGDVKYDNLTTPYVNVKVPNGEIETSQTILLGETGLSEEEIKENWQKDVYDYYRNEDGSFKYGAQPTIKFDKALDPKYAQLPTKAKEAEYKTTGELIPNKFEAKDDALEYVNKYGTVAGNNVPTTVEHKGEISAKHKLTVLDTTLEIEKQLNGKTGLPEWFEANFKIALAPEKTGYFSTENENFNVDEKKTTGTFTGLGLGEYTITETLSNEETANRVKQPAPLSLIITKGGTSEKPKFVLKIKDTTVVDNKYIVNNLLKDITLNIHKVDGNTKHNLEGVSFGLYELDGSIPSTTNLFGEENVTLAEGILTLPTDVYLQPGKSYQLKEIQGLEEYIPHKLTYTLTVDELGTITVSADGTVFEEVEISYPIDKEMIELSVTVKNYQKGALPATGGEGIKRFITISFVMLVLVGGLGAFYVYRNKKGGA